MRQIAKFVALSALVAPELAFAHPFHEHSSSQMISDTGVLGAFSAGLVHPWTGLDHLLALVAVALWSLRIGGRAPRILSATFLFAMAIGVALGALVGATHAVEGLIALSLVAFGALAYGLSDKTMSTALSVATVALFATFHGVAHGAELPASAAMVPYLLGACGGAAGVLALSLAIGARIRDLPTRYAHVALRSIAAGIVVSALLF